MRKNQHRARAMRKETPQIRVENQEFKSKIEAQTFVDSLQQMNMIKRNILFEQMVNAHSVKGKWFLTQRMINF